MIVLLDIAKVYEIDDVTYVQANLLSDVKPATLPTTGAGIEGLANTDHLAPGTTIMTKQFATAMLGGEGWGSWVG